MRQIFLDTETTGLSADDGDRVIEIGCVEMVRRKLTGQNKHFYLNPGRESHEDALRVHGITSEFLKDKPQFEMVVDELMSYLAGAEVIIHNAAFDVGFLDKELQLLGRTGFRQSVASITDTLVMAKEMFPGKRNSLDALCSRLDIDNSGRTLHGALLDAELLADVYINLTRGQDALLMEVASSDTRDQLTVTLDLSDINLQILQASESELAAHDDLLNQIDKSSGGKTIWRKVA